MVQGLDSDQLREYCTERRIHWIFTTPAAPNQNGCAEALVKSCKRALKKAIGEQVLTPFELYTCLLEVGNLVKPTPYRPCSKWPWRWKVSTPQRHAPGTRDIGSSPGPVQRHEKPSTPSRICAENCRFLPETLEPRRTPSTSSQEGAAYRKAERRSRWSRSHGWQQGMPSAVDGPTVE